MSTPHESEALVTTVEVAPDKATVQDSGDAITTSQWYWVDIEAAADASPVDQVFELGNVDKGRWLGCVTHVGSNFAVLTAPRRKDKRAEVRVHFDVFHQVCTLEPNADEILAYYVSSTREEVNRLLAEVKEVTARLSIGKNPALESGAPEVTALAIRGATNPDMNEYSKSLSLAKEKTLPELFEKIRQTTDQLATWMTANVLPLKVQATELNGAIAAIDDRIFSVELYAGLVEKVERVRDGAAAPLGEKIRLFQRRFYMDEECLARYQTGGMTFKEIGAFDTWISRPDNFERILPFPRCVVAFRIRRREKEFHYYGEGLGAYLQFLFEREANKATYLYLRNGERLYRLTTAIEFGSSLFPDMEHFQNGRQWAEVGHGVVHNIITDARHEGLKEEFELKKRQYEEGRAQYEKDFKAFRELVPEDQDTGCYVVNGHKRPSEPLPPHTYDRYTPFDRSSVWYDDIAASIARDAKSHNRVALILQGLLDRSPVFHPHPAWQTWTQAGFEAAFELVLDESRALTEGEAPSFELFRESLNASLKPGSVTFGQQKAWRVAQDETDRAQRRKGLRYNPGPGEFARVERVKRDACTFSWLRPRRGHEYDENYPKIAESFTCNKRLLLNVSAYRPGDYKKFFNDPRTRAHYLQWAPLLLEAEEYCAGNRVVSEPVISKPERPPSTYESRIKAVRARKRRDMCARIGQAVRLAHEVTTKGGISYKEGTLWRIEDVRLMTFTIARIAEDGSKVEPRQAISRVNDFDVLTDTSIPAMPKSTVFTKRRKL